MRGVTKISLGLPDPALEIVPWLVAMREDPRRFARELTRAVAIRYAPRQAELGQCRKDDADIPYIPCPECGALFATYVVMCAHRVAAHKYVNPLRRHVTGSQCGACRREFHTYRRLYDHVRCQQKCADYFRMHVPPMSEEETRKIMSDALLAEKARDGKIISKPCIALSLVA